MMQKNVKTVCDHPEIPQLASACLSKQIPASLYLR